MVRHGVIPRVKKPARIAMNRVSAIDHIIRNSVINRAFKIDIIKTDIPNYFPIFFVFKFSIDSTELREEFIYRENNLDNSIETLK